MGDIPSRSFDHNKFTKPSAEMACPVSVCSCCRFLLLFLVSCLGPLAGPRVSRFWYASGKEIGPPNRSPSKEFGPVSGPTSKETGPLLAGFRTPRLRPLAPGRSGARNTL